MKSIFLVLINIMIFPEGRLQNLQSIFLDLLIPKEPGLTRVRKMDLRDGAERRNNVKVLDFIGLVEQYDYPAEEHNVTTEDGYNLKLHRIPGSPSFDSKNKKEIVFIQHGILASSDSWVVYGTGKDLAFLLVDQGYDVWIGNMRGNTYCRSHTNMTIYDPKFWQFSFHELGTKDLPAMFDYIFNYTQQTDLYYIGHSMGTTSIFTLLSSKPEYNMKMKMVICLAPVAFWTKVTPSFNGIANTLVSLKKIFKQHEIYDVFPQCWSTIKIARTFCNDKAITQIICVTILFFIVGPDPAQLNTTTLPEILSYYPAGTSIQTFDHYYQNLRKNEFRMYDYGVAENYERYKQKKPPSYDLKKITAPTVLIYSDNDNIVPEENVLELSKRLPNVLLTEKVPYKLFNHADFMWAIDVKTLLYDRVLELIQKFDVKQNKFLK
ncbi:PREDICTED: lipase 3-like isoform X2 [Vollenhovia emeryi]|uniref:lipase 3-like isoform X2 n=1 Tax=Vollenhovia emeryi TaxID=411798 RepID=UPI0005F54DEB|nr:PREDICTED: lipase 3-like isoform X2 [Vollenhovia emeryi]